MSVYKNGQAMKEVRPVLSRASLIGAVFGLFSLAPAARAQVASTPPVPGSAAGRTFSITPYAWLPAVSTTYSYTGPRGVFSVTNTINAGIGDYISELNFGLMLGGEARYDRFTIRPTWSMPTPASQRKTAISRRSTSAWPRSTFLAMCK